ncbi:MAG: ribosome maturation factor RimP [Gammaproteobacteria bacterium]|nr:MAG: ribosome maturation factor RimP [Gammaproteobacteria bacterium]
MALDLERLKALLAPAARVAGCELLGVEFLPAGARSILRLYIDRPGGVTLDDCEAVSYQVSGILDVEDPIPGHYVLEVSSPGLDRPLFTPADYERFAGRRVDVRMQCPVAGRKRFRGTLQGHEAGRIRLLLDDGRTVELPLADVHRARLVPDFAGAGK